MGVWDNKRQRTGNREARTIFSVWAMSGNQTPARLNPSSAHLFHELGRYARLKSGSREPVWLSFARKPYSVIYNCINKLLVYKYKKYIDIIPHYKESKL